MRLFNWVFESWGNTFIASFFGAIILVGFLITYDNSIKPIELYPHFYMPVKAEIPKTPGYLPNASRTYRDGIHEGIDLTADLLTPVKAARAGQVIETGIDPDLNGNYIVIAHKFGPWYHSETWKTKYCHLSQIWVEKGLRVDKGQVIALSGCTGYCLAPHLHFAIYRPDGTFLGKDYSELELQLLLNKYISN